MDEIESNKNGGHYVNGRAFYMTRKPAVSQVYTDLCNSNPTKLPSVRHFAKGAQVSTGYAFKVMQDYYGNGAMEDPCEAAKRLAKEREKYTKTGAEESLFLLSLCMEDNQRPLYSYQAELLGGCGLWVSHTTIHRFFNDCFDFAGKLRKPNLVPLDKWINLPTSTATIGSGHLHLVRSDRLVGRLGSLSPNFIVCEVS